MRGKHLQLADDSLRRGLIPAHAGKTKEASQSDSLRRAHPRACGENGTALKQPSPQSGSSPRMRGKRSGPVSPSTLGGLIPAHAGKTSDRRVRCHSLRAHPRACGENRRANPPEHSDQGSSPRMRGKPERSRLLLVFPRLIPAHAGKTHLKAKPPQRRAAHPRACGENGGAFAPGRMLKGSSPRMRGKRVAPVPEPT